MTEHLQRTFGDADFPPDLSAEPQTLFDSLDPQLEAMLALFKAAINAELAAAWVFAVAGTQLADRDPVQSTLWAQPTKAMLRAQGLKFPLLSLTRVSGTNEELTLTKEQVTTLWALDYLLGPLTAADYRSLAGALPAALKVLQLTLRELGHPNYQNGQRLFDGFNTVGIKSFGIGPASFGEDGEGVEYYGLHIDFETTETDKPLDPAVADYLGGSFTFAVGDAVDVLEDMIEAETDLPPPA